MQLLFSEMPPDEQRVWRALQAHAGRASAITGEALAEGTGLPWRECRQVMKDLIEIHHKRIGSSPSRPAGYYIIETPDEEEATYQTLKGQAISTLKRASVIRRVSLREIFGQLALEV